MIESQFKTVLNYINLGARPAFILYLLHIIFPFILWVVVVAVAPHSYWIFFWFLPLSSFCLIIARAMIINLSPQGRKYQEQDFSIISNAARCTDVTFSSSVHPCLKKIPTKNLLIVQVSSCNLGDFPQFSFLYCIVKRPPLPRRGGGSLKKLQKLLLHLHYKTVLGFSQGSRPYCI